MSSCWLVFPEVRSSLVFSGFGFKPPASRFQSYFYSSLKTSPSSFEDNGLLFWVPDVLCWHSGVVSWNFLSVQMFFWWICGGESGLPILFLYLLGIPPSSCLYCCVWGGLSVFWQFVEFSLLWSFLTVGRVGRVACQCFLIREACVGVLVGRAGFHLSGEQWSVQ